MADERPENEADELDAIGDPELLKHLIRAERRDAAAREKALTGEMEALKTAMRPRLERPDVISLADLKALPLDARVDAWQKAARGALRIDPKAPKTPKPIRFMTAKQIDALPLDERYAARMAVLRGEVKLL